MSSPPKYDEVYPEVYADYLEFTTGEMVRIHEPPVVITLPTLICDATVPFWLFLMGFGFPVLWILGTFFMSSQHSREMVWAKMNLFAVVVSLLSTFLILFLVK